MGILLDNLLRSAARVKVSFPHVSGSTIVRDLRDRCVEAIGDVTGRVVFRLFEVIREKGA
jgi:hypothetical protein